ncbi:ATP-binding protein [Gemmatimonas sp.]|uniref:sensor histidine kinase n=1 Tax=Gemmatimonas sp. TaxID=1962908 RepID=UPI0039833DC4
MRLLRWFLALSLLTLGLLPLRPSLDKAHVSLAYLLLILAASARAGRRVGLVLSVVSFFCFNFFFVEPLHSFVVAEPLDWLVLVALLITSAVAAHLLSVAQSEARTAWERAAEIDRLAVLGAESLNAGPAEQALDAIAGVIQDALGVDRCRIFAVSESSGALSLVAERGELSTASADPVTSEPAGAPFMTALVPWRDLGMPTRAHLLQWVAENARVGVERIDGSMRVGAASTAARSAESPLDITAGAGIADACGLLLPLRVHEKVVGVVHIERGGPLDLTPSRQRFLRAISYYAALGIERARLVVQAEHTEALRQADKLKDAVLASVSHDLRTPLTTIKALANAIRLEGDDRAAIIEEEADRLNRFVADLLDLSRLDGGAMPIALQITAVEDLLGAALQRVSGVMPHRAIDVQLPRDEPLLLARLDFTQSLRIVVNLLENADKYSPADQPIGVSAQRVGDMVRLSVSDRGAGIADADRERIFEPFHRVGDIPDANGTGLGLSIARRLAERQGGRLVHEPRAGGGSCFVLELSAAELEALASL